MKLFPSSENDSSLSNQNFGQNIKQNQTQYDLDKNAAKVSGLPSGNLNKYEYMIGEDLNYKPDAVE